MNTNGLENKKFLSIGEAAKLTGMGQALLRRAYENGVLKGFTTPAGQRRFSTQCIQEFCNITNRSKIQEFKKINYLYARVSSKKQSDDLVRQVNFLRERTSNQGIEYNVIEDIRSGVNLKRKGLQTILDNCLQGIIGNVTVAHRDRLSRFGFDLIESIIKKAGGTLTVIDDNENKSTEQELAEDLLSIVHIYSCRQMGKRSYSNKSKSNNKNIMSEISTDNGKENEVGSESSS